MLNAGLFNIPKKKNSTYIFHQIMLSYNVQQNFIHINIVNEGTDSGTILVCRYK